MAFHNNKTIMQATTVDHFLYLESQWCDCTFSNTHNASLIWPWEGISEHMVREGGLIHSRCTIIKEWSL